MSRLGRGLMGEPRSVPPRDGSLRNCPGLYSSLWPLGLSLAPGSRAAPRDTSVADMAHSSPHPQLAAGSCKPRRHPNLATCGSWTPHLQSSWPPLILRAVLSLGRGGRATGNVAPLKRSQWQPRPAATHLIRRRRRCILIILRLHEYSMAMQRTLGGKISQQSGWASHVTMVPRDALRRLRLRCGGGWRLEGGGWRLGPRITDGIKR